MSQTLTYVIGQDRRPHVDNVQDFKVFLIGGVIIWKQKNQPKKILNIGEKYLMKAQKQKGKIKEKKPIIK